VETPIEPTPPESTDETAVAWSASPPSLWKISEHWEVYLLLALALVARFWGIGDKSLWTDEAKWLLAAQAPLSQVLDFCTNPKSHTAPAREVILHFLSGVPRPYRDGASRVPSALAGAFLIPVVYFLGRMWIGRGAAIGAAGYLLLHPWHIYHSQDNRMHAVFLFFYALSLLLLCRALYERRGKGAWALWGVAMAVYAWFTYLITLAFAAQGLLLLAEALRRRKTPELRRIAMGASCAAIAFLLLFSPWMIAIGKARLAKWKAEQESIAKGQPVVKKDIRQTPYYGTPTEHLSYYADLAKSLGGFSRVGAVVTFAFGALGAVAWVRKRGWSAILLIFFGFFSPVLVVLATNTDWFFPDRYLTPLLTYLALLAGTGIALAYSAVRSILIKTPLRRLPSSALTALAIGFAYAPILASQIPSAHWYYINEKQAWRYAMLFLEANMQDGDTLVTGDHWAECGVAAYTTPFLGKRLGILSNIMQADRIIYEIRSNPNVWYIHWAFLPDVIRQVVDAEMRPAWSVQGINGIVTVYRRRDLSPEERTRLEYQRYLRDNAPPSQ
jgi:hypothetical protein